MSNHGLVCLFYYNETMIDNHAKCTVWVLMRFLSFCLLWRHLWSRNWEELMFNTKFRTRMHSMACVAWQFRQALLSGKDAKVHTTRGKAQKIKTDCPDPWPFQLIPPSTHFDTPLISISPANQRYDSKRFEIKCRQAKHDSKARDNVKRDRGVCLNKQRLFCYTISHE